MNLIKKITITYFILLFFGCADYKTANKSIKKEKTYYSSFGFAMIYEEKLFKQKIIDKKINNDQIEVIHYLLKKNTPIKITNLENLKTIETKVSKKANYPKFFNVVLSNKVAEILELDEENPYVEILEIKKNKTFIAKEGSIFEEERNVAEKLPVENVQMDNLNMSDAADKKKLKKKYNFTLVISDFYYIDSANNLRLELTKKTKINNFSVEKIHNNQYRLSVGPFDNFKALKSTYISLNNLGFEDLNIYKKIIK